MAFGDSDLPTFFNDFGVSVLFGAETTSGILETPSEIENILSNGGAFEQQERVLTIASTAFAAPPKAKDALTVDGTNYTVKSREYIGDGKTIRYRLKVA